MTTNSPAGAYPPDPQQRWKVIQAGFRGPLPPKPTSPLYVVGLIVTTVVMVLLPLIYVGMIFGVGYIAFYHLAYNHTMMQGVRGRGIVLVFLAYLAPGICGAIMTVFMIKPLFSARAKHQRSRSVTRQSEPLLFAVVDKVCELVGSAKPQRIDVDCNINASASFRNGFLSLLTGNDLVLTIGLPLVAGLTLKQLVGVLAHEFGHFSQGAGMRLTYIIRSINFWFMRVAYERDEWDEWLAQGAAAVDFRIGWVLYLAMLCVWITRKILWALMMLGNIVAGFMLRQMEYDADTYEARLVGRDTFALTAEKLSALNLAHNGAMSDLSEFHREGRLVDNLPRLIEANVEQIPAEILAKLQEHIDSAPTALTDSHPTDRDRIQAVQQFPLGGVFDCSLPATALFGDFHQVASAVTADLYRDIFETGFDPQAVHSVDLLLSRQQRDKKAYEAFERFMAGHAQTFRFLNPKVPTGPEASIPELRKNIDEARKLMQQLAPGYQQVLKEYDDCDDRLLEIRQCEPLTQCGIAPKLEGMKCEIKRLNDCSFAKQRYQPQFAALSAQLRPFEEWAELRLGSALVLLFANGVEKKLQDVAAKRTHAKALMQVVRRCCEQFRDVMEIRDQRAMLGALFAHLEENHENAQLFSTIQSQGRTLRTATEKVWSSFGDIPYPFDHAQKDITVQSAFTKTLPPADEFAELHDVSGSVLQGVASLYARSIARLGELAEEVEQMLGRPPLAMDKR